MIYRFFAKNGQMTEDEFLFFYKFTKVETGRQILCVCESSDGFIANSECSKIDQNSI